MPKIPKKRVSRKRLPTIRGGVKMNKTTHQGMIRSRKMIQEGMKKNGVTTEEMKTLIKELRYGK